MIQLATQPEYLDLREVFDVPGRRFAVRVRGDWLKPDAIRDGDFVIVQEVKRAKRGQMALVSFNDTEEPGVGPWYPVPDVTLLGVIIGLVRQI